MPKNKKTEHIAPLPLETRHVFLDTQVFFYLKHNIANPALRTLKEHIQAHRISLHLTDITLLEIKRQILESISARAKDLNLIEKDLRRWRHAKRAAPGPVPEIAVDKLSEEIYGSFQQFVTIECRSEVHSALDIAPKIIFDRYFDRKAPFDKEGSKEFPDAFALEALSKWCHSRNVKMYIVTEDAAMLRAADDNPNFLQLRSIQDILARAASEFGERGEEVSEAVLHDPGFDYRFEEVLNSQIPEATFVYLGDLPNGEAYEGYLQQVGVIYDWNVVALSDETISMIVSAEITVVVDIQYEDRSIAGYDLEEDRWFGTSTAMTEVTDHASVEVFLEINLKNGNMIDGKILNREIPIYGNRD